MAGTQEYSTNPTSNDGLGLMDEGQTPSSVNNGVRQVMADIRRDITAYTDSGSANAYEITIPGSVAPSSLVDDFSVWVDISTTNSGASTLDVNSLGATAIKLADGNDPASGQIVADGLYLFKYNGTNFILVNPSSVARTYFGDDTGSANTYAMSVGLGTYLGGQQFYVQIANVNTGTSTLDIDGLGAKTIRTVDGVNLVAGMIQASVHLFYYNSNTQTMVLLNPAVPLTNKTGQVSIGNNAVGQFELKSTTATQSVIVSNSSYNEIALTGATYTLFWTAGCDALSGVNELANSMIGPLHNDGTYATKLGFRNNGIGLSKTVFVYSRYIQACRPYDLGDGDVPFFAWLKVKKSTGEIVGTCFAEDPFWTNWGPTQAHAKHWDTVTDRGYGITKITAKGRLLDVPGGLYWHDAKADPALREEYLDAKHNGADQLHEITHKIKNHDMHRYPHPFMFDKDLAEHDVILVDPVSSMNEQLAGLHAMQDPEDNPDNLLRRGDLKLDNTEVARCTPNGVKAHTLQWR